MRLVRIRHGRRISGLIVEVEAYPPSDPASHAFRGLRPRCRSMFLPHWFAYVYKIYGVSHCLNISSEVAGVGAAVLIRALEPQEGLEQMGLNRGSANVRDFTRGPGRLTQALGIDLEYDGVDLDISTELFLEPGVSPRVIAASKRIGLSKAIEKRWRFFNPESPYLSGTKAINTLLL